MSADRDAADRPLLLLDVDGVLQPTGRSVPPGYERHVTDDSIVVLNSQHGVWLRGLLDRFEVVWATTWGESANALVGARLGLPIFRHIELGVLPRDGTRKLAAVQSFVGDRLCVWIDDELYEDAQAWAAQRSSPTLLVSPSAGVGLTSEHVEAVIRFADDLRS